MFVAHYFGLPRGLQVVQAWCRERGVTLVEDCAHSYFGQAGERPVGQWGDYATASLSKFFPVAEAGMLASARHALLPLGLRAPGARAQIKAVVDVFEFSRLHRHLAGLRHLLAPMFWLKSQMRVPVVPATSDLCPTDTLAMMESCDMGRALLQPTLAAVALHRILPMHRIAVRRQANYRALAAGLVGAAGARALFDRDVDQCAPYVFPLWVDGPQRADAVYARMRADRLPVFRWDRMWPGTPVDKGDVGTTWTRQVLQLLCHQSLSAADIRAVADATLQILRTH
ncbi:MAG: hypothetical protein ABT20_03395 [Rubrivivax sp. SCN 70-15]|nr:MAG: hypothetical protein ABT20_03395 [Rubrivivax sp. SCN 70-15]